MHLLWSQKNSRRCNDDVGGRMAFLLPQNRRYWWSSLIAVFIMAAVEVLNRAIVRIIPLHGGDGWAGTILTIAAACVATFPNWPIGRRLRWMGVVGGIVFGYFFFHWNAILTGPGYPDLNRESWGRLLPLFYGLTFGLPAGTLKALLVHYLLPSGMTPWGKQLLPPAPAAVAPGLYTVRDNPAAQFNIVFVHGVHGHYEDTWSSSSDRKWPHWVADHFANSAVYSVQYSASVVEWTGNTMPLVDRAGNVLDLLDSNRIFLRPTVFIVHSFGGLVLKQLWRFAHDRHREDVLNSIRCIVFIATPHTGSRLGEYAQYLMIRFLARPTVTATELESGAPQLRELNQWYRDHPVKHNFIYFETQNTEAAPGIAIRVVDEVSSDIGIPRVHPTAIEADHLTICKPLEPNQQIVTSVNSKIETVLTKEAILSARAYTSATLYPDFPVGRWRIISDVGHPEQVWELDSSNQARGQEKGSDTVNTGTWKLVDGEAQIEWNTGWKDRLRPEDKIVRKFAYAPGTSWDGSFHNTAIAIRE